MKTIYCVPLAFAALVYLTPRLLAQYSKDFAGPYNLNLQRIGDCPNGQSLPFAMVGNKLRKYNRTTYLLDCNLTTSVPLTDDVELAASFSTFGNGGWSREQLEQKLGPMCTSMWKYMPQAMGALMKSLGQEDCPIKPGFYVIKDFQQHSNINWPLLPYGRYRFSIKLYQNGKLIGCKRVFVDCVPKKDRRPGSTTSQKS